MTIKILPPQLANQIAAGEVVERPASVVKELVENALDAGADKIEIEVDKGGHKRLLIRDNGKGIAKSELTLALSRHATSKISDLDDLEAIVSLGFRGEALASISSVSRLTMTSKPAEQNEAWAAIAEGLEMDVTVRPAAHPNGTSVEVVDLFFNTPARRKFLRAEKTEFAHIETLIKRIALSRPDVTFILKHNGKLVKRYRGQASTLSKVEQTSHRICDVINRAFVEASSACSMVYDEVEVAVWVKDPSLCVSVNPAQYSFVNGRMMRDKLIQHAIRQAYASHLHNEQQPEYVVFIDLPASEVDVNVHPAKHEVRFHHARLLHDLVVKTMQDALHSFTTEQPQLEPIDSTAHEQPEWSVEHAQQYRSAVAATAVEKTPLQPNLDGSQIKSTKTYSGLKPNHRPAPLTRNQLDAFDTYASIGESKPESPVIERNDWQQLQQAIKVVQVEDGRYAYFLWQESMWLIDLLQLSDDDTAQTNLSVEKLSPAPLLVPVRLKINEQEKHWCEINLPLLTEYGFEVKLHGAFLIIKQVPSMLRGSNSGLTLPNLFERLMAISSITRSQFQATLLNTNQQVFSQQQSQQMLEQFVQDVGAQTKIAKLALQLKASQLMASTPKSH